MLRTGLFARAAAVLILAVAALGLTAGSARAFYWYDWPGSSAPTSSAKATIQSTSPQGGGNTNPTPPGVPEPASMLAAATGLGVLGAARAFSAKRKINKK